MNILSFVRASSQRVAEMGWAAERQVAGAGGGGGRAGGGGGFAAGA